HGRVSEGRAAAELKPLRSAEAERSQGEERDAARRDLRQDGECPRDRPYAKPAPPPSGRPSTADLARSGRGTLEVVAVRRNVGEREMAGSVEEPISHSSDRTDWVKPTTPRFAAEWALKYGAPRWATMEDTWITTP